MLCVPIQVELIEEFSEPVGTSYIALGGFVTGWRPGGDIEVHRPYLLCIAEDGRLRSIPVDVLKFVTVLPQAMFAVEPPAGSAIVSVSSSGRPVGVS